MNSIKQWPLLATASAMILIGMSSNENWMRIASLAVGIFALIIVIRANIKK